MITPTDGYNIHSWKVAWLPSQSYLAIFVLLMFWNIQDFWNVLSHNSSSHNNNSAVQHWYSLIAHITRWDLDINSLMWFSAKILMYFKVMAWQIYIQCVGCETFKAYESRGRTCCLECESRGKLCARSEASARCCLGKFFLPPGFQEVLQQQFVFVKVSRLLRVEASGAGAGTHWSKQTTVVFSS